MNRLSRIDRERVVACLVEGNSIRATVRITGVSKKTVSRLAVELGRKETNRIVVSVFTLKAKDAGSRKVLMFWVCWVSNALSLKLPFTRTHLWLLPKQQNKPCKPCTAVKFMPSLPCLGAFRTGSKAAPVCKTNCRKRLDS